MNKEDYHKKKKYIGDKKPSMQRRSDINDYTDRGMYMFTLVIQGRRPLFGEVIGDSNAPEGSENAPRIKLTELGRCVKEEWWACSSYHPEIKVVALQMMPDHLHGILYVTEQMEKPVGMVIRGFKQSCNKHYRRLIVEKTEDASLKVTQPALATRCTEQLPTEKADQKNKPSLATRCTEQPGCFEKDNTGKGAVSYAALPTQPTMQQEKKNRIRKGEDRSNGLLFAPQYNDKILHKTGQLDAWIHYLRDNPRRLLIKRQHPDYFRVQFNLKIGNQTYSALGNQFLLSVPDKRQVQCSRALTETEIQQEVLQALSFAQQGSVHISPAISPGEKAVMRALMDNHFPIVYLEENGLTSYTKPGGEFFEACTRGQLLILAPWEHHNEKMLITRDKCLALNNMAKELCEITYK